MTGGRVAGESGKVDVQRLNAPRQGLSEIPPADGRDLVIGLERADAGARAAEQRAVLGALVGLQREARVTDEPQASVGRVTGLLQQLARSRLACGLAGIDLSTRQFPGLSEPVEDHQDAFVVPQGHQRAAQRCVTGRCFFRPEVEGDQGIPAVVDDKWHSLWSGHSDKMPRCASMKRCPRPRSAR